jgi:hypothetical protein
MNQAPDELSRLLSKPLAVDATGTFVKHDIHLPHTKLTLFTQLKFWYKNRPKHNDEWILLTTAVNMFTLLVTLIFIMPWLNDLKQMGHQNTVAWIDRFNQTWLKAMHTILKSMFSTKELSVISGLSFPMNYLLTSSHMNRASLQRVVNANHFARSFMNVLLVFIMFTTTVKATAHVLPNSIGSQSHFNTIMNYYGRSLNNRSGIFGFIESVKALTGQPTTADRYVNAFRGMTNELLGYCGYVWMYSGAKVVVNGYTLFQHKKTNLIAH